MKKHNLFLLISGFLLFWTGQIPAAVITPPDDNIILSESNDISNSQFQWIWDVTGYAGGGVEPTILILASLNYYSQAGYTEQQISRYLYWNHMILPRGDLPEGFDPNTPIPYRYSTNAEGSISSAGGGGWIAASATVGSSTFGPPIGSSINFSQISQGTAKYGDTITVAVGATINLTDGAQYDSGSDTWSYAPTEAVFAMDPFLYIDPSWAYVSYFGVFQAPGPNDGGVWMEVTREWQSAVPVPPAIWLFLSGLLGLAAFVQRH